MYFGKENVFKDLSPHKTEYLTMLCLRVRSSCVNIPFCTSRTAQGVVVQVGYNGCDCGLYSERCSVRMSTRAPSILTAVSRAFQVNSGAAP